jgi:hypothetical protein
VGILMLQPFWILSPGYFKKNNAMLLWPDFLTGIFASREFPFILISA